MVEILLNETVRCLRMSYDFARASMTVAKIKDEMINSMMLLWCVLISIISSGPPGLWGSQIEMELEHFEIINYNYQSDMVVA